MRVVVFSIYLLSGVFLGSLFPTPSVFHFSERRLFLKCGALLIMVITVGAVKKTHIKNTIVVVSLLINYVLLIIIINYFFA